MLQLDTFLFPLSCLNWSGKWPLVVLQLALLLILQSPTARPLFSLLIHYGNLFSPLLPTSSTSTALERSNVKISISADRKNNLSYPIIQI